MMVEQSIPLPPSEHPLTRYVANELLSDIFTMCAASQPLWSHCLLLSSCQAYRPPLWSQPSFTANPRSASWCTNLFLPRSGAHPLDISINLLLEQGLFVPRPVMKIMQ
ncbi:hypothetical protein FIBSPDRAFT_245491 [Athelia psychrophila]|uniref:Uncharacterized protein n=1 Tax=Athelia psychrophila TaxID=1759441 RepID=A0A166RTC8_9AGAM|nr:hypothetical protein FIBSPDRAFT_245491 [Fibularhizoctonia sp. CBS 109695]